LQSRPLLRMQECDWAANTFTREQAFCFGRSIQDSGDLGVPRAVTCGAVSGQRIRLPISSRENPLLAVFSLFGLLLEPKLRLLDKSGDSRDEVHSTPMLIVQFQDAPAYSHVSIA
jgi:hypothetical protein